MKVFSSQLLICLMTIVASHHSYANCDIDGGHVRVIGNEFPAVRAVTDELSRCANDAVEITVNLTSENKKLHVPALSVNPAEYTASMVGNAALVPLLNENLIRPLDPYIKKFGTQLSDKQRVTIDGQTMAVAFLANAQHLFYRSDILKSLGLAVPTTYEEMLHAASVIREKGNLRYPLGGTYQAGWNLALEFINLYLATGESFFVAGTAAPAINNQAGVDALQMMKALSEYMNPDFLSHGPNEVQAQWQAGTIALTNLWGSRAAAVMDSKNAIKEVVESTEFAASPAFGEKQRLASSLWWIGFTLARNISEEDANATFKSMLAALSPAMMTAHRDKAVWLIDGYKPTPSAQGVFDVVQGKSQSYPMSPSMTLLHAAIGTEIIEFLQGKETAEQALDDVENVYRTSATEAGFLQ